MIEKHEGKSLEHMIVTSLALREISSHFNSTYCSCIPDTIIKNTILASNDTRQCRVHELKSVTLNIAISLYAQSSSDQNEWKRFFIADQKSRLTKSITYGTHR